MAWKLPEIAFWVGGGIIVVTHLTLLTKNFPATITMMHAVLNLAGAALATYGYLNKS